MAVTQAFFDPTEPYVAGSVFINTLSSFTNRRFAMNQQFLEQRLKSLDPATLNEMRSDIQTRIDKLERQKESEYDIEKVIADETTRYKMSAATDKRAADRVASSKEKAATKALIVSKKKIDDAMDDAFAASNIEDIAKQIADTTGIEAFRDVIDAKGLQATLRNVYADPAAREEKLKTAMKSLYGVPSEEGYDKVTTFSDVEEMSDIDFEKFYDAFKGVYGLNPESTSRSLDDPNFLAYEEIKKETKDKAEKEFEGSSGTGVFIDTSFDAARKKAEINRAKQRQAAEAKNKQIQDQIDALEMQKIGLSEQLEKALSGDTSDIYGGLAELGIRNLRLGTPFQQAGAIQRREPIERSRDIDLDIAGMIPRPEIEIPKRKDTDELEDDFDFEFAPAEIDFIPTEKPEEPPPRLDPLIRGRFKRDPLDGFYDDQGGVVDESMRPPEVTVSPRMALVGEILELNPELKDNPQEIQAMVTEMSMPVLQAYHSNMVRERKDRQDKMTGGGKLMRESGLGTTEEIPVGPVDADILDAMPEDVPFHRKHAGLIQSISLKIDALTSASQKEELENKLMDAIEKEDLDAIQTLSQNIPTFETPVVEETGMSTTLEYPDEEMIARQRGQNEAYRIQAREIKKSYSDGEYPSEEDQARIDRLYALSNRPIDKRPRVYRNAAKTKGYIVTKLDGNIPTEVQYFDETKTYSPKYGPGTEPLNEVLEQLGRESGLGTTEEIPVSPVDADILDAMPEGKKLIANTKIKSAYEKQLKTGEPVMMLNDFEVYITIGENGRPQFRLVAPDGTEQIVDQMRDFNRYNIIEAQLSK